MSSSRKKILVLTSWGIKEGLIQSYTLPYLNMINTIGCEAIYLQTLEKKQLRCSSAEQTAYKQQLAKHQQYWISHKYVPFGLLAIANMFLLSVKLFWLIKKEKIDTIHAICTPSGMLGYVLSKLTKVELIIDSFEPHSALMLQSNTWKKTSLAYRMLAYFEKKQAKHAHICIAANKNMKAYTLQHYGVSIEQFLWKPSCVSVDSFLVAPSETKQLREILGIGENDIICVCASKIGGMYLTSEIFDFFEVAESYWKGRFKVLLLNNHPKDQLDELCFLSGVDSDNVIQRYVPHHEIPLYLSLGDFAFSPLKAIPANYYTTPIKNGEYWAAGLPTVITKNISEDSEIIEKEKIGHVLQNLTSEAYLNAIQAIDRLLTHDDRASIRSQVKEVAQKYRSFTIAQKVYQQVYGN